MLDKNTFGTTAIFFLCVVSAVCAWNVADCRDKCFQLHPTAIRPCQDWCATPRADRKVLDMCLPHVKETYTWAQCVENLNTGYKPRPTTYESVTERITETYEYVSGHTEGVLGDLYYITGVKDYSRCVHGVPNPIRGYTHLIERQTARMDSKDKVVYIAKYEEYNRTHITLKTPKGEIKSYPYRENTCYLIADPPISGDVDSRCHYPTGTNDEVGFVWDETCRKKGYVVVTRDGYAYTDSNTAVGVSAYGYTYNVHFALSEADSTRERECGITGCASPSLLYVAEVPTTLSENSGLRVWNGYETFSEYAVYVDGQLIAVTLDQARFGSRDRLVLSTRVGTTGLTGNILIGVSGTDRALVGFVGAYARLRGTYEVLTA